ncbi:calpain-7 isoform X2 [Lampris incognitus]|uniref:calpain-7 isoform X2 n=1 Tax=Lampris incognitus TaxID=2546036 RepID=UPI0024B4D222|nr:calpain-7 isoform X2 [Lampris incognitus]
MDCTALEHDAVSFAKTAVTCDQSGRYNDAVFYYKEAAQALIYAGMAGSQLEGIQDKVNEYLDRVQALHNAVQAQSSDPLKSRQQVDLERAHFLVTQAFQEDEKGNADEAIELYTQAVELCIRTSNETSDQTLQVKLKQLARQALERAEGLKESQSKSTPTQHQDSQGPSRAKPGNSAFPSGPVRQFFPLGPDFTLHDRPQPQPVRAVQSSEPQGQRYTSEEIEVLRSTSTINCMAYVPFMSVDLRERFAFPVPFSIIYPQNRRGEPEYNPCGKYMVKLHINGVPRKVIIDDYLPVDRNGELLCSYSSNRNELWVSLIEKAYMKVMGGYDFPGSNSNIDLHALTGWIPERIAMHSDNQSFSKDDTFRMLYQRFHRGDVLITTATGVMTEEEGERWGLVPTHAYAVLDIREHKGMRFLQLKNPWSHLRWRGRFSERDEKNWTPELLKYLNFDPKTAQRFDNGVFWIAWEDLCQYYDVIYLSWNPALFRDSSCIHSSWDGRQGPVKDAYSLANNPQYRLEVQCPAGGAAVWVLLTRHITDKDDFAQNREFITLVVYKTEGKKVYYPADPPPYIDGIRINSPHYLTKMKLTSAGTHTFTLVVSQYEKQNTINYTLRVYSGCKFSFSKIPTPFTHTKRINGQWKGLSAGGCSNYKDSYKRNPTYQFNLERPGPLLIELRGSRQYSVGFEMVTVSTVGEPGPAGLHKKSSGDYRCGFCYLELDHVPAGIYNVTPTTFLPKQEGHFFLDFGSATPLKVSLLP